VRDFADQSVNQSQCQSALLLFAPLALLLPGSLALELFLRYCCQRLCFVLTVLFMADTATVREEVLEKTLEQDWTLLVADLEKILE